MTVGTYPVYVRLTNNLFLRYLFILRWGRQRWRPPSYIPPPLHSSLDHFIAAEQAALFVSIRAIRVRSHNHPAPSLS